MVWSLGLGSFGSRHATRRVKLTGRPTEPHRQVSPPPVVNISFCQSAMQDVKHASKIHMLHL